MDYGIDRLPLHVDWYVYPRSQAARRSADAGRVVEFVGGPYRPEAVPAEYLTVLRRLLARYRDDAPEEMLAPASRYLDLVEATL